MPRHRRGTRFTPHHNRRYQPPQNPRVVPQKPETPKRDDAESLIIFLNGIGTGTVILGYMCKNIWLCLFTLGAVMICLANTESELAKGFSLCLGLLACYAIIKCLANGGAEEILEAVIRLLDFVFGPA